MDITTSLKALNKSLKLDDANGFQMGIKYEDMPRIKFSSPELNYMTYGGLPQVGIVEFYGDEGSGKTTMALDIIKNYQSMDNGRNVLYVDAENKLDRDWAIKLGVDVDNLIFYQPGNGTYCEMIFDNVVKILEDENLNIGLCVFDSIASLLSKKEVDNDSFEDKVYCGIAGIMATVSKKLSMLVKSRKILFIGINQKRDDLSGFNLDKTPGGRTWKFFCIARLGFRRGKFIDENNNELTSNCENPAGHIIEVRLAKNQMCSNDRRIGHTYLKYMDGIDYISGIVEIAMKNGRIKQAGAWYSIVNTETGEILTDVDGTLLKFQGKTALNTYIKEHKDLQDTLS